MRYGIQKMQEGWFCFMFFIMGISNGEKKLADRKSTRQNSSHGVQSRMPSSA